MNGSAESKIGRVARPATATGMAERRGNPLLRWMPRNGLAWVIWKISLPILFVEAAETVDHLIDTLFLSRVGVTELGAIGVADSVLLLFLIPPLCMVDGLQILTARRAGQGRSGAVGTVFNQGLLLVLMLGALATAALELFSPVVANWLVESEAVGNAVGGYLRIDAFSIPLTGFTFACGALLTSLGKTRALVPATIILVVVDVILNYLFIFGKMGCPQLGMRGAAIGSIGAELAVSIYLASRIKRDFDARKFGFFRFKAFDRGITRLLSRLSAPLAAQCLLGDLRWFAFFLIIERVGAGQLAVANVVFTCFIVFSIPLHGFAETVCSMVSRYVGKGRTQRIGGVLSSAVGGAMIATAPFILLALFAPQWVAEVFSSDEVILGPVGATLRVVALAMLIVIPAQMWHMAVEGTGDTTAALAIEFVLSAATIGFTWLAAMHFRWPMEVVWLSMPAAWLISLAVSYGWMKSGLWKRLEV